MKKVLELISKLSLIAGLLGVSATMFLNDEVKAWIALVTFIIFLIFTASRIYLISARHLEQRYPKGYLPLSAFARYVTSDGDNVTYELFRHIQVKKPVMSFFNHQYLWSGTQEPRCESDLQEVESHTPVPGKTTKNLKLKFRNPRIYSDVEVIHLRMKINDSDHRSGTFLLHTVESPIRVLCFRVELLHANSNYNGRMATVTRKCIESGHAAISETIETIPFDASTKSFFYQISDPEPGYYYQLSWERP